YAFCKGANGSLTWNWRRTPLAVRGVFGIRKPQEVDAGLRLIDISNADGTSITFAMGEAAGGTTAYLVRDLNNPGQPALEPSSGKPIPLEQSWSAAGLGDTQHPWYGSVFAVTAQYGLDPDPRDEPMNRRPGTPTVNGGDTTGTNQTGKDAV